METTSETTNQVLTCAARWGLPGELVEGLGLRLHDFWQRYRDLFANATRDPSPLAKSYLRAQLTMETKRNLDRKSTRLNSSHSRASRMPSSA